MPRGGARKGAGRPRKPVIATDAKPGRQLALRSMIDASDLLKLQAEQRRPEFNPWKLPDPAPGVLPKGGKPLMAMDEFPSMGWANSAWTAAAFNSIAGEGLLFPGYAYLSELAQRPEYRTISETIATEMTRKWIKFKGTGEGADDGSGDDGKAKQVEDKIKELTEFFEHLKVRDNYSKLALQDGLFGRTHLYHEIATPDGKDPPDDEIRTPIGNGRDTTTENKVTKGSLKRLQVIEPVWTYPTTYNAQNPLRADWYNPQVWYVMGKEIHVSRMPAFVGREVPDMLKPAYYFGGLSMTQLAQPYVDIWLRTRQSVADMIHSFSVMVLHTDLSTLLQPGAGAELMARLQLFNRLRDNQGAMVVNQDDEDLTNVSAPISGLSDLQAQAQEHMMSVARIPAVKFTGMQPKGLNATSEGELRAFYDTIHAFQGKFFRPGLTTTVDLAMISLWGARDPDITFDFEPLWALSEKEQGEMRKSDAEVDQIRIDSGVISQEEARKKLAADPDSGYDDIDPEDVPDLLEEEAQGLEPEGGRPQPVAQPGAEEGGSRDAVIPFAGDQDPLADLLAEARRHDRRGYLQGVTSIEERPDTDQWNAHYDAGSDRIAVERKFFRKPPLAQLQTVLHEAGHRGAALDPEALAAFKARGLGDVERFKEIANPTHLEDLRRTGKVDDAAAEVFAESYARAALGLDLPAEIAEFWKASIAADEAGFEESKHPRDADWKFASSPGGGSASSYEDFEKKANEMVEGGFAHGLVDLVKGHPDWAAKLATLDPQMAGELAVANEFIQNEKDAENLNKAVAQKQSFAGKSKKEIIGHLLTQEGGTTTAQILKETGWPSVSVPQQAAALGLKLTKFKGYGGSTWYKATPMTDAEKLASKAVLDQKKKAGTLAPKVDVPPILAPKSVPTPTQAAAAVKPQQFPAPTAQELEKAKKNVALQLQYVPGNEAVVTPPAKAEANKAVAAFNEKYAGKELKTQPELIQKVNDFKLLGQKIGAIANADKAQQAEWAKKQAAEAAEKAAAQKAEAAKVAKENAAKNKHYMDELGINEQEAVGFDALVKMMGGDPKAFVGNFKKYENQAANLGYPITGFQCALIKNYSDGGYQSINGALRQGSITEAQHVYVKMVNKALQAMPRHTGTVKRGASLSSDLQKLYKVGHVVEERAFTSTSTGSGSGGNTNYVIKAIGKRGAEIKQLSNYPSENEVLFAARTFFKVTKIEGSPGGQMTVHMEEMDD